MFFKKLVMFCQSLADDCCSLLYWLIIYKPALDKNRPKRGGEWCLVKVFQWIFFVEYAY